MGTLLAIEATSSSLPAAESAIGAAFAAVSQIVGRLHPHTPGSDLDRINRAALRSLVEVHPDTWELLRLAHRLNALTDGVFDPCLPSRPGRLCDIEMASDGHGVTCHEAVALDFGGFAKGFAIDRAIEALLAHGCEAGVVNAGGDLRLFGPNSDQILLRLPNGELK
jgi:thiamine biosynthesis lipoprotein